MYERFDVGHNKCCTVYTAPPFPNAQVHYVLLTALVLRPPTRTASPLPGPQLTHPYSPNPPSHPTFTRDRAPEVLLHGAHYSACLPLGAFQFVTALPPL